MSLSAAQTSEYHEKWWKLIEPILSELLTSSTDDFLNKQIGSTFFTVMGELRFGEMLEELLGGYDIFIQDEWSVELPKLLIEKENYVGDVIIDLAGGRTPVRLEHFCFVAKIAAIFYARYMDPGFDPWTPFAKIDQFRDEFRVSYIGVA
jgi:hypothetical protein